MKAQTPNTRTEYCPNCKAETDQFVQFSMNFFDKEEQNWICRRCANEVLPLTREQWKSKKRFLNEKQLSILLRNVSEYYNVSQEEIRSVDKKKSVQKAKRVFNYLAYTHYEVSFREIGLFLGNLHETAHRGHLNVQKELSYDKRLPGDLNAIMNMVRFSDKLAFFKEVLQTTPPEKIPLLITKLTQFRQNVLT